MGYPTKKQSFYIRKKTAFLLGTPNFFVPSYFVSALNIQSLLQLLFKKFSTIVMNPVDKYYTKSYAIALHRQGRYLGTFRIVIAALKDSTEWRLKNIFH